MRASKSIPHSIELDTAEPLILVTELARESFGKRPSPATIWRWRQKGVRGVRLPCVTISGGSRTSRSAWQNWLAVRASVQQARSVEPMDDDLLRSQGLLD